MGLGLGPFEMVMIFLVVLLLFGAKRLPEIGSSLGKGIREFKSSVTDIKGELKVNEETRPAVPPAPPTNSSSDDEDGEPRRLTTSN